MLYYQVAEVPAKEVDHEEVERLVDPLAGHGHDGSEVDDDAYDGDAQASWSQG
jgi:hypothetical protein